MLILMETHHYEIAQESGDTEIKIKVEVADYPSATACDEH